jgi:hypothetical protein
MQPQYAVTTKYLLGDLTYNASTNGTAAFTDCET